MSKLSSDYRLYLETCTPCIRENKQCDVSFTPSSLQGRPNTKGESITCAYAIQMKRQLQKQEQERSNANK